MRQKKSANLLKKNLRISQKKSEICAKKVSKSDIFCFVNRRSGFRNFDLGDDCRPAGKVVECIAGGPFRG